MYDVYMCPFLSLLVIEIFVPNLGQAVFCDGICEWRRAVLPSIQREGLHWEQDQVLWSRDNNGSTVPAQPWSSVQRSQGVWYFGLQYAIDYFALNVTWHQYINRTIQPSNGALYRMHGVFRGDYFMRKTNSQHFISAKIEAYITQF